MTLRLMVEAILDGDHAGGTARRRTGTRLNIRGLVTFEEFCDLIRTPQRTLRDWRQRGVGPRWARSDGCGRLDITVAEASRFLTSSTTDRSVHSIREENVS